MPTRTIDKQHWEAYFDRASRSLRASNVDLEVAGMDLGNQIEAEQIPLEGLSYDPKDDAFYVICEGLDHQVRHPRQISVREDGLQLQAVEIIDEDDHTHLVKLSEALQLPGGERPRR